MTKFGTLSIDFEENKKLLDFNKVKTKTNVKNDLASLLVSTFAFTPLTVIYWIGTWDVFTLLIIPQNLLLSCVVTFFISNTILILAYVLQDFLQNFHHHLETNGHKHLVKMYRFIFSYILSLGF